MTALVFMDTETTGLSLDDDIWEFAAVRREPDGEQTEHHFFIEHDQMKCARLPESFRLDHVQRYDLNAAISPGEAAARVAHITRDRAHVVGAVPNFDTERLGLLLADHGVRPYWHYHLIDVENLAVGYLLAKGQAVGLPWNSDELSRACGIEPPTDERHTAMGDVRWAMALYDHIAGGTA